MGTLDIRSSCNSPTFGLQIKTDEINNRVYIADVDKQSSADTSLNFQQLAKNKRRQLQGAYITAVNGTPVFDKASVIKEFRKLRQQIRNGEVTNFTVDIAPVPKNPRKTVWKECDEQNIFIPDPQNDNSEAALNVDTLKSIALIRLGEIYDNYDVSHEEIVLYINALRLTETTLEASELSF